MRVLTLGTFDLFHAGHVRLLERCRALAGPTGSVVVGLNRDAFVTRFKGRPPVIPYTGRAEVLRACRHVDLVMENGGDEDCRPTVIRAAPEMIVVGSDWLERDYLGQTNLTGDWLQDRAIALCFVPYTAGVSSSAIRARL